VVTGVDVEPPHPVRTNAIRHRQTG
jgi:hypothetical protein